MQLRLHEETIMKKFCIFIAVVFVVGIVAGTFASLQKTPVQASFVDATVKPIQAACLAVYEAEVAGNPEDYPYATIGETGDPTRVTRSAYVAIMAGQCTAKRYQEEFDTRRQASKPTTTVSF